MTAEMIFDCDNARGGAAEARPSSRVAVERLSSPQKSAEKVRCIFYFLAHDVHHFIISIQLKHLDLVFA